MTDPQPHPRARTARSRARWLRPPTPRGTRVSTRVFAGHRGRPFADLLARVDAADPRLVVDLGCGPGDLTLGLARRWPDARVVGVDSSPEMLARARELDADARVEWVEAAAEDWDPTESGGSIDVLVTNATLQWVPSHLRLIPSWVASLAPGGTFAMQVPANFDAPSHRLMREVAARHPRADDLRQGLARAQAVAQPQTYAALLLDLTPDVDVWQTTYEHVLAADARGAAPGPRVGSRHGPAPGARRPRRATSARRSSPTTSGSSRRHTPGGRTACSSPSRGPSPWHAPAPDVG